MRHWAILTLAIVLVASVAALTWTRVGNTYVVTLTSGNQVNVTNITYDRQAKVINATLTYTRLSAADVVEIDKTVKTIQDQLDRRGNSYNLTVIHR